jgi:RND family efflux transporter MFP subunit
VLGDVYEVDIGRVHVGTPAKVTVPAYPDKVFEGRVDWVSGGLDAVTRTARVRCTFENPDELLRPSMYATVRITVDERKALAVPAVALLRLGEYTMVFVQIGELDGFVRYERLPVEVVDGEGPWLEVTHGLDLGQQVVVSGAANLSQKI